MIKRLIVPIFASFVAGSPVMADETPLRVVVLGDSLAAGLHLPADRAFPAALQRQLELAKKRTVASAMGGPLHGTAR